MVVAVGLVFSAQVVGRHWYAERLATQAIASPDAAEALLARLGELEADAIGPLLSVVQSDEPRAAAAARSELDTLLTRWQRDPWQQELRLTNPRKYVRQMEQLATSIEKAVPLLSPRDQEWASLLAKKILRALPTVTAEEVADSVSSLAVLQACEKIIDASRLRGVTSGALESQIAAESQTSSNQVAASPAQPIAELSTPQSEAIIDLPPPPMSLTEIEGNRIAVSPQTPQPTDVASQGVKLKIDVREPAEFPPTGSTEPSTLAPPGAVALSPESNLPWQATRPSEEKPSEVAAQEEPGDLARLLQDSDRQTIAREAGQKYASLTDRELIIAYLAGKPETVARLGMSWQLTKRGFAGTQDRQLRMLVGSDERDRVALAGELLTAGNGAIPLLFLLAEDRSANVRSAAIAILGASRQPKIVQRAWQLALADRDPKVSRLASELSERLR